MNKSVCTEVIKRYLRDMGGATPEYWEQNWAHSPLDLDALAQQVDPRLVGEIERHLPPRTYILEGGCGSGAYVAYLYKRGYKVVGVDFAEKTVARLNEKLPILDIRVGNIRKLPFTDNMFDAYYSGGVIEHFEDGLQPQIDEAFRVIKPGGIFFVTVPYINAVRKVSACMKGNHRKIDLDGQKTYWVVDICELQKDIAPQREYVFHEYVLGRSFMISALESAGFYVEKIMPFSSRWGLLDVSIFRKLAGIDRKSRHLGHKLFATPLRVINYVESAKDPISQMLAQWTGLLLGNLCLYVARKSHHG